MTTTARSAKKRRSSKYDLPLTEEQQALVAQWQYLVPWYMARYCAAVPRGYYRESLETVLIEALIRAAQSYNPSRAAFNTHCTWRFRGAYSAWLNTRIHRSKDRYGEPKPLEIPASEAMRYNLAPTDSDPFESRCYEDRIESDTANDDLCRALRRHCNPREWDMLTLKFQEGWTLAEIGERHGVTRERVRQVLASVRARLRVEFRECVL